MRPSDLETEEMIIGTILRFPASIDEAIKLSELDFDNPKCRDSFNILKEMSLTDQIDWIEFGRKAKMKTSEVVSMANKAISIELMPSMVKKLRDLSKRRAIIDAGQVMIDRAQETHVDTDKVLGEASEYLASVSLSESKEPEQLINVVERVLENCMSDVPSRGIPTGLKDLDDLWGGFYPGEITVLAARPSMGKTALAQKLAIKLAKESGLPVPFFSLEMSSESLVERYVATALGIEVDALRRRKFSKNFIEGKYREVLEMFAKANVWLQDDPNMDTYKIQAQARKIKRKHGLGAVIVDYLTLIDDEKKRGETEALKVTEITRKLASIGKTLDVPMLVLAQLSRAVELRDDKRPIMRDLKESGGIEERADHVLFLYREEYYNKEVHNNILEIIVAKQKQGPRMVTANVHYDASTGRFRNLSKHHGEEEVGRQEKMWNEIAGKTQPSVLGGGIQD